MADLLHDIKGYLGDDDTIHIDTILDSPNDAIALYEYEGSSPIPQIAGALRSVQVVVRSSSVSTARSKASTLYKKFLSDDGIIYFTESRWAVVQPKQLPFKLKVDEQNRTYYAFNVGMTTSID